MSLFLRVAISAVQAVVHMCTPGCVMGCVLGCYTCKWCGRVSLSSDVHSRVLLYMSCLCEPVGVVVSSVSGTLVVGTCVSLNVAVSLGPWLWTSLVSFSGT